MKLGMTNRIKQFKYKLIHKIIPSKEVRFKWKMSPSPCCNICNLTESYEHLFIRCPIVTANWLKLHNLLLSCGIDKNLCSMQTVVMGYKLSQSNYYYLNVILSLYCFCIYKAYFLSDSRTKSYDIYRLFKQEFNYLWKVTEKKSTNDYFLTRFHDNL